MELGRLIYAYRTKRNLSQGDLADALGVSRQSVSKWETSNATPDLDKLVKLSELFGITLDELVGRQNAGTPSSTEPPPCAKSPARITVQQIIGVVLLCTGFAFLVFSLSGTHGAVVVTQLVLSVSCILCGAICLKFQKHAGFLCALLLYLFTWIPVGVLSPNYIRLDIARILQLSQILWGVLLGLHGHRLCKIRRNAAHTLQGISVSVSADGNCPDFFSHSAVPGAPSRSGSSLFIIHHSCFHIHSYLTALTALTALFIFPQPGAVGRLKFEE